MPRRHPHRTLRGSGGGLAGSRQASGKWSCHEGHSSKTAGTRRRPGRAPKPSWGRVGESPRGFNGAHGPGGGPKPPTRTRGAGRARAPPHRPATPIAARTMHLLERPRHPGGPARGAFLRGGCRAPALRAECWVFETPRRPAPGPPAPKGPGQAPWTPEQGTPCSPAWATHAPHARGVPPEIPRMSGPRRIPILPRNSRDFPRRRPPGRRP